MRSVKPHSFFRRSLLSVLCAVFLLSSVTPSHAGFLRDFYNAAGTQGNITSAGLYQSNALNTVTGGGFVYRAPRSDFNPFYLTPPSLSAGCGGIDLFLGAFGIPSREEFVAFLRNIGTALPGLAFQLALQSLAPDLSEQITNFRDLIREYTAKFSDSCTAAQSLLKMSGAQEWIEKLSFDAKSALRSSGQVSDASEADRLTRTSGATVIASAGTAKDSGGAVVDAAELNLTWALLSGGEFSAKTSRELKEIMMSLVGTVLYVEEGSGDDAVIAAHYVAPLDLVDHLFGSPFRPALDDTGVRYACADDVEKCLELKETALDDINLPYTLMQAALRYRESILRRDPSVVSEEDLMVLTTTSSIPILRLINATASRRYLGFSQDLLAVYVEAASFEAILKALDRLALDLKSAVQTSSARDAGKIALSHAKLLEERIGTLRSELYSRSDAVFQQMSRAHSFVTQIEHLEKSLKTSLSGDLAATLAFERRIR
jgi:conjugative transfer pilus assembly protein TraH